MTFKPDCCKQDQENWFDCKVFHPPIFFSNTKRKRVPFQKHLNLIVDSSLPFDEHLKLVKANVNETMDILPKLHSILLRNSLLSIQSHLLGNLQVTVMLNLMLMLHDKQNKVES